ncbi:MAG: Clp protease ClpP [Rubripirellula sp.]|nr:Clp protease ClpP [Rubripirellula sp.]
MHDLNRILALSPSAARNADGFRVRIENRGESTYIAIDDLIGDDGAGGGIPAKDFANQIRGKGPLDIFVNTPGGSFFDGCSIYQALRRHKHHVSVEVGSLAFSAGSLIVMGGDLVRIHASSAFGIHRSHTIIQGNQRAVKDGLQWLEKIDEVLVAAYAERTKQPEATITRWLDGPGSDGSLWSGAEAVELGFADELIGSSKKIAASKQPDQLSSLPQIAAKKIDDPNWAIAPKQKPVGAGVAAAQMRLFKKPRRSI